MQASHSMSAVVFAILSAFSLVQASPLIKTQQSNGLISESNLAVSSAIVPTALTPQGESRNQNPARAVTREDTQIKTNKPVMSPSFNPSQISSVHSAPSMGPLNTVRIPSASANPKLHLPSSVQLDPVYRQNYNDQHADHSDRIIEGSGAGPQAPNQNQKVKLDDTEDSEDDSDDEDYDYKDTAEVGSGRSNGAAMMTQKPALNIVHADTIQKPAHNDFYKPFRPPVAPAKPSSINQSHVYSQTGSNSIQPPLKTSPTPIYAQPSQLPSSRKPASNDTQVSPSAPPDHKAAVPMSNKNKNETDYEYDDENGDDETEETSVFEDNDASEPDLVANKTHPILNPSNISTLNRNNETRVEQPPPQKVTNYTQISPQVQGAPSSQSLRPKSETASSPVPTSQQQFQPAAAISKNSSVTTRPYVKETTPSDLGTNEDDEEEEEEVEEEDEDDEEEEPEEDEENPDRNQASFGNTGLSGFKYPVNNAPVVIASTAPTVHMDKFNPATGTRAPPVRPPVNTQVHATLPTSHGNQPANQYSTIAWPPVQQLVTSSPNIALNVPSSTTTAMLTVPPARPPIISHTPMQTLDSIVSTKPPSTLVVATTVAPGPSATGPLAPYVPIYFPTTVRPYLTSPPSYPTRRVPPSVTTNVEPYDRKSINYSFDDDSLTRQIFDKVLEVYREADKTVRDTWDAVWPPNVSFDSRTLEPLLSQPVFFMFALGGTIICLVLLMMLIVYMISYQTKPRRYEHDDISIY